MAEVLVWSPDVAWVNQGGILAVALLPDGPVTVLTGAGPILRHMEGPFTVEGLVSCVTRDQPEHFDELRTGIQEFIEDLQRVGLVVTAGCAIA